MRTAEDYYEGYVMYEWSDISKSVKDSIIAAINIARTEAIKADREHVANHAKWLLSEHPQDGRLTPYVDKDSIINAPMLEIK